MRFSLGLLLVPMADDLQWSRTSISTMATVFMIVTAAALPFTGQLVDRLGPFRILTNGVILAGLALVLTSQISEPWHGYVTYGVLFAIASAATSITPVGVILTRVFPHRVGLANSIAISGMGVGQLLIVSVLAAYLIQTGWRGAYFGLGMVSMLVMLPLLYWASRVQSATGQSASRSAAASTAASPATPPTTSTGRLVDALRVRSLWLVFVVYGICGFQDFFIATHIVALAVDASVNMTIAGQMLAFMGLAGLAGVLVAGVMADRYGPASVTLLCFVFRCVLFVAMLLSREAIVIVTCALVYGSTFWMTAPLTVVFAKQLAGAGLLGLVSGLITMVHHGAGGLGAAFGAIGFDRTGDYDSGLRMMLALSLFAAVLTIPLFRQRF